MGISAAQCRAARALLDWSQDQLATNARVGRATVADFERNVREPMRQNLIAITSALEAKGVEFIPEKENGSGVGVRFRKVEIEYSPMLRPVDGENIGLSVQYRGQRYMVIISREMIDDMDRATYGTMEERVAAVSAHLPIYLGAAERRLAHGGDFARNRLVLNYDDLPSGVF